MTSYPMSSTAHPSHPPAAATRPAAISLGWDLGIALIAGTLLLTILEGALRKWALSNNPAMRYAAYVSKDILFLFAAYMGLNRGRRVNLAWLGLCALLVLVPSSFGTMANSNLVGALLSVRAYLIIPLCAFLAVPLVRHFADIERCAKVVALVAIPVAALGVVQYRLPTSHILNRYDTEDARSVNVGSYVRATGTFSYIAGMTTMACLAAWAGVLLIAPAPGRKKIIRMLGAAAIAAGGVCAAVSMSRGAVLGWGFVCVAAFLLYQRPSTSIFLALAGGAAIGTLILIRPGDNFENAVGKTSIITGVASRFTGADSTADRLALIVNDFMFGISEFPFGLGLGLGQPGGLHSVGLKMERFIESEWGRIGYEVGVLGLIGALVPRAVAAWMMWRGLRSTTNPSRRLVLAAALPMFCFSALGTMAFNHTGNSAAWAVVALSLPAALPIPGERRPGPVARVAR